MFIPQLVRTAAIVANRPGRSAVRSVRLSAWGADVSSIAQVLCSSVEINQNDSQSPLLNARPNIAWETPRENARSCPTLRIRLARAVAPKEVLRQGHAAGWNRGNASEGSTSHDKAAKASRPAKEPGLRASQREYQHR